MGLNGSRRLDGTYASGYHRSRLTGSTLRGELLGLSPLARAQPITDFSRRRAAVPLHHYGRDKHYMSPYHAERAGLAVKLRKNGSTDYFCTCGHLLRQNLKVDGQDVLAPCPNA